MSTEILQFSGRSAAEAAIKACESLGTTRSKLVFSVLSEDGEGLSRKVVISVDKSQNQVANTRVVESKSSERSDRTSERNPERASERSGGSRESQSRQASADASESNGSSRRRRHRPGSEDRDQRGSRQRREHGGSEVEEGPVRKLSVASDTPEFEPEPRSARTASEEGAADAEPRQARRRRSSTRPRSEGSEEPRQKTESRSSDRSRLGERSSSRRENPGRGRSDRRDRSGRGRSSRSGNAEQGANDGSGIDALIQVEQVPKDLPPPKEIKTKLSERAVLARSLVAELVAHMGYGLAARITQDDEEGIAVDLFGGEEAEVIGQRGEVLLAMQFLINRMVSRELEGGSVITLDAAGYRGRRRDALAKLAHTLAGRSVEEGKVVRLSPMSAHDRRIFHVTLAEGDLVKTQSEGDGLFRSLLIIPNEIAEAN